MTPYHHAQSSVARWGGRPADYIDIHNWLDETKQYTGDWTHRALRHHAAGVQWAVERFGHMLTNSDGHEVPIKLIAERHVVEDCGFIPTAAAWLRALASSPEPWMLRVATRHTLALKIVEDHRALDCAGAQQAGQVLNPRAHSPTDK